MDKLLGVVGQALDAAERDNNMIYFQPQPADDLLPPLPPAAVVLAKTPYEEPKPAGVIYFELPPVAQSGLAPPGPPGDSSAQFAPSAPVAPAVGAADASRPRSDSDMARYLQARFNAGFSD